MRVILSALALFLCFGLLGCDAKPKAETTTDDSTTEATASPDTASEDSTAAPAHPARVAANKVLAAIVDQDAAAIKALFNKTNQEKVGDDDIAGMLKETKDIIGDVKEISELRKGRSENEVLGKVLVADEEVLVVVLTEEDGKYLFEDLNSPDVESYEALEKIE